jgi:hypothetical protein
MTIPSTVTSIGVKAFYSVSSSCTLTVQGTTTWKLTCTESGATYYYSYDLGSSLTYSNYKGTKYLYIDGNTGNSKTSANVYNCTLTR